MDKKAISNHHLLWIDLEMTGLDPRKDKILEIAAIVTDWDLQEVASFESGVGHDHKEIEKLLDANPFYIKMKENKRSLLELSSQSPPEAVVERMLVDFVRTYCDTHYPVVLAGNSIHIDRQFISAYWPHLDQLLHYRMLDVTSWKLVFENRYAHKRAKNESHRALEDIHESIEELKEYLKFISV